MHLSSAERYPLPRARGLAPAVGTACSALRCPALVIQRALQPWPSLRAASGLGLVTSALKSPVMRHPSLSIGTEGRLPFSCIFLSHFML